jgi:hypothetical protein
MAVWTCLMVLLAQHPGLSAKACGTNHALDRRQVVRDMAKVNVSMARLMRCDDRSSRACIGGQISR